MLKVPLQAHTNIEIVWEKIIISSKQAKIWAKTYHFERLLFW